MASADFVTGNTLTLLNSGAEYFPQLIAAINAARSEVHLETYIFAADHSGLAVADALIAAARRGVTVRVLVDGFGTPDFATTLQARLAAGGVMVLVYRPEVARLRLRRHRLRRLHRKLALIDAAVAFVGGINLIDDASDPERSPGRYDYAVRVEGPLLVAIECSMRRLWEIVSWVSRQRRFPFVHAAPGMRAAPLPCGDQRAAFVVRDNIRHRRDIEDAYLAAIDGARESIVIANAYFLPGRRFWKALTHAARRGVAVSIVLQGRVEYRLLHYATQALYDRLQAAGIRIFEYERCFLHAKVAVVDHNWATVGSSNIDPFSLLLAKEANVVTPDARFAAQLRASLEQALASGARELPAGHWRERAWTSRLLRWASYQLLRAAIGISGYGGQH